MRTATQGMDEVETARALVYGLLGHALAQSPEAGFLARLGQLNGGGEIGTVLRDLAARAQAATVETARTEYDALFIGVARGELVPYGSFYMTGFLHERPLARLRADLARLGLARRPGRSDPEDHIATECEIMASLADRPADLQAEFFDRHLNPWASRFFTDLKRAASARLYQPVGTLGRLMIELDRQGFALAADPSVTEHSMQRGAA